MNIHLNKLDDDNKFKCEKCSEYVNAEKNSILVFKILIFLVKIHENGVISNYVNYPIDLDINKYCLNYFF